LDDDQLDALTAYNLAELLRSGCTAQVEMSMSLRQARSYARVAERLGARGWVGGMVPGIGRLFPIWFGNDEDLAASEEATLAEIGDNLDFARSLGRSGLVQGMMTPHAADTHTPRTLALIASAAVELGTGVHTHLSQGARETETILRRWGRTPTQWLSEAGLLEGPFFGAHFTAPDWDVDAPILRAAGAVYSTCPSAGGAGGATQPWPEAIAAGVAVNIGIDTHSNDMIENLKLAVLYGQARAALLSSNSDGPAVEAPTVHQAVHGCTAIAADALERPDLGRIERGAAADLVAVDVSGFLVGSGSAPPEPLHNLLYANGQAVRLVMTDGRPQVLDGVFVAEEPDRIVSEGGRVAQLIWSRLEEEGWFT
jgi:cytosine/adenosine deaminase-related metal-dependent hydrolase